MYQQIEYQRETNYKLNKIKKSKSKSGRQRKSTFAKKIKSILGISAFIVILGLAGSSDFESEYCYTLSGIATETNFIEFEDGTGWYFGEESPFVKGKSYSLLVDTHGTDDFSDDTIRKIK